MVPEDVPSLPNELVGLARAKLAARRYGVTAIGCWDAGETERGMSTMGCALGDPRRGSGRRMVVNLRRLTLRDLRSLPRRVAREPRQAVEAWRQARKVASENGLNAYKILAEQTLLERLHGINRYSYYLYRLFEPGLSWEDKKSYLADDYYSEDRGEENVRLW